MDPTTKIQTPQDIASIYQNTITNQEKSPIKPSINFIQTPYKTPKIYIFMLSLISILILLLLGYYFDFIRSDFLDDVVFKSKNKYATVQDDSLDTYSRSFTPCIKSGVSLEEVNNVGYKFLLGQIDYPNTPSLTDDIKNNITQIFHNAKFPKKFLENTAIVIVNTLAIKPNEKIDTPYGDMDVPELEPIFLRGGGGIFTYKSRQSFGCYREVKDGEISIIYLNKNKIDKISEILTHELGHFIEKKMTDEDWTKYYQLRNIPNETPREGQIWSLSPREDFAEVYKYLFTNLRIKTYWGILQIDSIDSGPCLDLYNNVKNELDLQVQNCRREVMSKPDEYAKYFSYIIPYKSIVDEPTKDFVLELINRIGN